MAWFSGPGGSSSPRRSSSFSQRPSSHHGDSKGYYYKTSSSHSSRARPREGYINRILSQIKRYLRHLYQYARKHPVKLMMLLLPLLTGGALAGLLAKFGIRLPASLAGMMQGGTGGSHGYGGKSYGSGDGGVQSLMKMAQMFV